MGELLHQIHNDIKALAKGTEYIYKNISDEYHREALCYIAVYASRFIGKEPLQKYLDIIETPKESSDDLWINECIKKSQYQIRIRGWKLIKQDQSRMIISNGKIRAWISQDNLIEMGNHNDELVFEAPGIITGLQPNFIVADGKLTIDHNQDLSRIYLNISYQNSCWALSKLVPTLNDFNIPFQFKCPILKMGYDRVDSGVLYVRSTDVLRAYEVVNNFLFNEEIILEDKIPRLTMRIGRGIGFADEPSDIPGYRQSFGQWVASLCIKAGNKSRSYKKIVENINQQISDLGRDTKHPFLRKDRTFESIKELVAMDNLSTND